MEDSNNTSQGEEDTFEPNRVARSVEQLISLRRWSAEFESTLLTLEQKLRESEKLASRQRVQFLNAKDEWKLIEKNLKSRLENAENTCKKLRLQADDLYDKERAAIERIRFLEAQVKSTNIEKQSFENSIKKLTCELKDSRRRVEQELRQRRILENQMDAMRAELKQQKIQVQELLERLDQKGDITALKKEISDRERLLQDLKAQNDRQKRYLQDLRSAYMENIEVFKMQLHEAKNAKAELQARIVQLESERRQYQLEAKSRELEIENVKRQAVMELENQNKQMALELNKIKLRYQQVAHELEDFAAKSEARIKDLETRLRQEKLRVLKLKEHYETQQYRAQEEKAKAAAVAFVRPDRGSIERIFPEIKSSDATHKLELVNGVALQDTSQTRSK
jgi:chromosome segregation ATPase